MIVLKQKQISMCKIEHIEQSQMKQKIMIISR